MSKLILPTSIPDWAAAQHAEILAILGRIQRNLDLLAERVPVNVNVPEPQHDAAWD
jgi:hypothetical protein